MLKLQFFKEEIIQNKTGNELITPTYRKIVCKQSRNSHNFDRDNFDFGFFLDFLTRNANRFTS